MKLLLTLIGCCLSILTFAQNIPQSLRIQVNYERGGHHLEQAVETIEAINLVGATGTVAYEAGRSVVLLPGFQVQQGGLFSASIKPIARNRGELSLQLRAYPNPFELSTIIDYNLPTDGKVTIVIMDTQGKVVSQLLTSESQSAGKHQVEWYPVAINSGTYIPVIESNQQKVVGRIVKK